MQRGLSGGGHTPYDAADIVGDREGPELIAPPTGLPWILPWARGSHPGLAWCATRCACGRTALSWRGAGRVGAESLGGVELGPSRPPAINIDANGAAKGLKRLEDLWWSWPSGSHFAISRLHAGD